MKKEWLLLRGFECKEKEVELRLRNVEWDPFVLRLGFSDLKEIMWKGKKEIRVLDNYWFFIDGGVAAVFLRKLIEWCGLEGSFWDMCSRSLVEDYKEYEKGVREFRTQGLVGDFREYIEEFEHQEGYLDPVEVWEARMLLK